MEEAAALQSGATLQDGKYRIVQILGQGGFGITYEAEQVALNRRVAIKEFFMKEYCERDGSTSHVTLGTSGSKDLVSKFRAKFVREAQMIAAFNHPHIIKIYDVFEENGTAYYVMEYLEGDSLSAKVQKEGPMSVEQAKAYIREVGQALSYIHQRNCLHFDVKPSNIMLDNDGRAVLIDFGVSKHYDKAGQQTSSTPVGISKGYAPLEQYQQTEISSFTPATDIYALGATLYYLLTGTVPPGASEINEDGLPSHPSIPEQLYKAIETAMQPRRKSRPQSVAAFLNLLDGVVDEDEATTLVGVAKPTPAPAAKPAAPQPVAKPKPVPPKPKPEASKPRPVAPKPKPVAKDPVDPSPKPSRKGLWIAIAAGVVGLALALLLIPRISSKSPKQVLPKDSIAVVAPITEPLQEAEPQAPAAAQEAPAATQKAPATEQQPPATEPQTGSARITSTPAGAHIWLDGKNTGKVTPGVLEGLKPGSHKLVLKLDGYDDKTVTLTVTAGARAQSNQTLVKKAAPSTQTTSTQQSSTSTSKSKVEELEAIKSKRTANTLVAYADLDEYPRFQGGDPNTFSIWLARNVVYPASARENGIQGKVQLSFIINADGSVSDVKVTNNVDLALRKEAIRAVESSPKWTPGKKDGRAVRVSYQTSVTFRLQ